MIPCFRPCACRQRPHNYPVLRGGWLVPACRQCFGLVWGCLAEVVANPLAAAR